MLDVRWTSVCAGLVLTSAALPAQLTWRQAGAVPPARCGQFAFFDEPRGRSRSHRRRGGRFPMKIAFAGTPAFAAVSLAALLRAGH